MSESAVVIEEEGPLAAVLARPAGAARRTGFVLLNAGLVHRVGPGRLYVELARRLAREGFPSLRIDLSGVGDSPPRRDRLPFEASGPREARAALDRLAREQGCEGFVLLGLCSGALLGFHAALADARVRGAVLVNAPGFEHVIDPALEERIDAERAARYYTRVALLRPSAWAKLVRGRADLRAIGRALAQRLRPRALSGGAAPAAPAVPTVAAGFRALAARGTRLLLVFSSGDFGLAYLRLALGAELAVLEGAGALRVERIEGADHLMTLAEDRGRLVERVLAWAAELE